MNLQRVMFRSLLVTGVFLCQFHVRTALGQVPARVVETVDDARRITLSGNVHPLARAEFDRGAVAESQPIGRILLLLKRSDEQEAALETLPEPEPSPAAGGHDRARMGLPGERRRPVPTALREKRSRRGLR